MAIAATTGWSGVRYSCTNPPSIRITAPRSHDPTGRSLETRSPGVPVPNSEPRSLIPEKQIHIRDTTAISECPFPPGSKIRWRADEGLQWVGLIHSIRGGRTAVYGGLC